jgi:hypothetical protein
MIGGEIGGVQAFSFGSPSRTRFYAMIGASGKMVAYAADDVTGPYIAQQSNYQLLGGHSYFARFISGPGGSMLVTHQSKTGRQVQPRPPSKRTPGYGTGRSVCFIAPYKEAEVDGQGVLRLKWWKNNDGLKAVPLSMTVTAGGDLTFVTPPDVTRGVVIEVAMPQAQVRSATALSAYGLSVGFGTQNVSVLIGADGKDGMSWLGTFSQAGKFSQQDVQNRSIPPQQTVRLLVRENMIESYIGEYLGHVWSVNNGWATGRFSLVSTDLDGAAVSVGGTLRAKAWQMNIVGSGAALSRTASASSVYSPSFIAPYAFDASPLTRWCSGRPYGSRPEWVSVDLGSASAVTWFRVEWELAFATAYQLQVSTDNAQWSTVFATTAGEGGVETHNLETAATGRYFRLFMTAKGMPDQGYSLWDLQLHQNTDTPDCGYWEVCK